MRLRIALALALAPSLVGCTEDARFVESLRGDVDELVVRWEGEVLRFEPGAGHRDGIVDEALHVIADVEHVHRRAFGEGDIDGIRNGTENAELTFSRPLGALPDRDAGGSDATRALIVIRQPGAHLLDGNVVLCGDPTCGEFTSENDLADLIEAIERAWSEAYPEG